MAFPSSGQEFLISMTRDPAGINHNPELLSRFVRFDVKSRIEELLVFADFGRLDRPPACLWSTGNSRRMTVVISQRWSPEREDDP